MEELIEEMKEQRKELQKLVEESEKRGLENLSYEDTEYYGAYLGKVETLDYFINKYGK